MAAPSFGVNPDLLFVWYPVIFTILMGGLFFLFIKTLEKFTKAEVGLYDVAYNLIGFFSFLFFYNFANNYFADAFMLDLMGSFLYIFGFGLIFLPLIGLIFSWIKRGEIK